MEKDFEKEYKARWNKTNLVYEVEKAYEWNKWIEKIPHIPFPKSWKIQIIPPFGGAIVRFRVNNRISIYLDCYDLLGFYGKPYWEVYPYHDDVERCDMEDVKGLINLIKESLRVATPHKWWNWRIFKNWRKK